MRPIRVNKGDCHLAQEATETMGLDTNLIRETCLLGGGSSLSWRGQRDGALNLGTAARQLGIY